jgi:hypothetical protein
LKLVLCVLNEQESGFGSVHADKSRARPTVLLHDFFHARSIRGINLCHSSFYLWVRMHHAILDHLVPNGLVSIEPFE